MSHWLYALMAVAALAGAAGVMEAAAAAHAVADPRLATSANLLMLDAAASIAIGAFGRGAGRATCWFLAAATTLLAGGVLFSTDISLRVFTAQRLFPFAAPIGGTLMILGWLLAAATAAVCLARRTRS